jgi:hypothetical protein
MTNRMQPNSNQHGEVCYVLSMMVLDVGVHRCCEMVQLGDDTEYNQWLVGCQFLVDVKRYEASLGNRDLFASVRKGSIGRLMF